MKRLGICLVVIVFAGFTLSAGEPDVIQRARTEAAEDSADYHAFWWGVGGAAITALPVVYSAFFADAFTVDVRRAIALAGPPVGGMSLALVGYLTGKAQVPDARLARIQEEYGDSSLVALYESEYEQTLSGIQRKKRGTWALIGSGAAVGVMGIGFLLVYLTK